MTSDTVTPESFLSPSIWESVVGMLTCTKIASVSGEDHFPLENPKNGWNPVGNYIAGFGYGKLSYKQKNPAHTFSQ